MIKIKNLNCIFDKKVILKNIDLNIKSHLNILGANGSGKSTLAKSICNLIDFSGDIFVDNKDIKKLDLKMKAKKISYIPSKLEIYDSFMKLEEFVLLARFVYKSRFLQYSNADKEISKKMMELLGILHLKNHTIISLSSGEQQLAMIASALSQQSEIIIFDEPTANLDPKNSKIIAKQIKNLKKNHQVILITHDLQLAKYLNSKVVFIKDKKVEFIEDDFFKDEILKKFYGIEFNSMVVDYD